MEVSLWATIGRLVCGFVAVLGWTPRTDMPPLMEGVSYSHTLVLFTPRVLWYRIMWFVGPLRTNMPLICYLHDTFSYSSAIWHTLCESSMGDKILAIDHVRQRTRCVFVCLNATAAVRNRRR